MRSMLIIVVCLLSYVASTPLLHYQENPENIIFFNGEKDTKLIPMDRSIYNMRGQSGGSAVNSDGYLSQDKTTSPKELLKLHDTYLSGIVDEDHVLPLIDVFKTSAIIPKFAVLKTYFREVQDQSLELKIQAVLRKGFDVSFDPNQILLATWNQFCPQSTNGKEVQRFVKTFKCIIASDKNSSYTIFISDDTYPCRSTHSKPEGDDVPTELTDVNGVMDSSAFMTSGVTTQFTNETWNMTNEADKSSPFYSSDYKDNIPSNSPNISCFQLKYGYWCLTLTASSGYLGTCGRHNLFYYSGYPGNQRVYYPFAHKCLDRQRCHSSTSNVRYSSCNHCGAIHWDVRSDGTLREDRGANCIYISGRTAYIHHSNIGCARFGKVWTQC